MHELSVPESLLKIAVQQAEKAKASRVTDLHIVIGDLASSTMAEQATLLSVLGHRSMFS